MEGEERVEKEEEMEVETPAEESPMEVSDEVYALVRSAVSKMYMSSRTDVISESEMEEGRFGSEE